MRLTKSEDESTIEARIRMPEILLHGLALLGTKAVIPIGAMNLSLVCNVFVMSADPVLQHAQLVIFFFFLLLGERERERERERENYKGSSKFQSCMIKIQGTG